MGNGRLQVRGRHSPGLLEIARQYGAAANVGVEWIEGNIGEMFRRLGGISPPPPEGFESSLLWGTEDHVRELLGDGVEFERHEVEWNEPSPESYAEFMETSSPPLIAARAELGDELVHETFLGWVNDANEADDGSLRYRGGYLLALVGT